MSRRVALCTTAVLAACLAGPASAAAYFGNGAALVSSDLGRLEQGDDTTLFTAIAAQGRYVVFQTRARNFFADDDPDPAGQYRAGGIFRRDIDAGPLTLVANGDIRDEEDNSLQIRGAANPSTSADGRLVTFSTGESLVAADTNGHVDVYVRDMSLPRSDPGAFDLVSAQNASDLPASYADPANPRPGLDVGSELFRGSAISADGRLVVFRTAAVSSLPDRLSADTPAGQLMVRDRQTNTTTLVTRQTDGGAPAGGAGPAGISADGTTVLWTGQNAASQTRFLDGENTESTLSYYLWRRVADGAAAPTRRITGMSDPDDPACPPDSSVQLSTTATGPCYGPLTEPEAQVGADISSLLPAMSGDGRSVAFLTGSGPRPNAQTPPGLDLYLTNMSPGVSRKAGTVELTREVVSSDGGIESVTMTPNGLQLAITTSRTQFSFPALRLLSPRRAVGAPREIYLVDLAARTLERVLRGYAGDDVNDPVDASATIADGGGRLAFTSGATNLLFGDANERPDAFVAQRQPEPGGGGSGIGGGTDDGGAPVLVEDRDNSRPSLSVRAERGKAGAVVLVVRAPAAGALKATARARVGRPKRLRALATTSARARQAGRVRLVLDPVRRYRGLIRRSGRVPARVAVSFVAARGKQRLSRTLRVTFRKKSPRKANKR